MCAKKNFCTFRFSAKFSAITLILYRIRENSALISVDGARFHLIARWVLEDVARKSIGVAHLNFLLNLNGALLNRRS